LPILFYIFYIIYILYISKGCKRSEQLCLSSSLPVWYEEDRKQNISVLLYTEAPSYIQFLIAALFRAVGSVSKLATLLSVVSVSIVATLLPVSSVSLLGSSVVVEPRRTVRRTVRRTIERSTTMGRRKYFILYKLFRNNKLRDM